MNKRTRTRAARMVRSGRREKLPVTYALFPRITSVLPLSPHESMTRDGSEDPHPSGKIPITTSRSTQVIDTIPYMSDGNLPTTSIYRSHAQYLRRLSAILSTEDALYRRQ